MICLLAGSLGAFVDVLVIYPGSDGPGDGETVEVEVPQGVGPAQLAELLAAKGALADRGKFRIWLRLTGKLSGVRAGVFELRDDMTPAEVIAVISGRGAKHGIRITIPEGFTVNQIAETLEDAGIVAIENFWVAAGSERLLSELGVPAKSVEGYLFPDTYFFDRKTSAEEIVRRMHQNFRDKLATIDQKPGADLREAVILASIVQAEARVVDEMGTIAGVYTNRLASPRFPTRLLQADPTVAYGCEPGVTPRAKSCDGFTGTLTRRQLDDRQNPYNTYKHPGLPPGPICTPGLDALRAAFAPADVPYFYFVARKDGRHQFSETLDEHHAAVKQHRDGN
ncbi:MAG: endolytic transglycosylase MltG [Deltaproteobacteria bacterium]|nr:endolytic transglycosylase MltG [Deltaproteobacteria bacterium]